MALRQLVITYSAVHVRLKTDRGAAVDYLCVDCGTQANEWSYTYRDPDERTSRFGPYSMDLKFYEPRCVSCHRRLDSRHEAQRWAPACLRGHTYDEANTYFHPLRTGTQGRRCRACQRAAVARYKARRKIGGAS